MNPSKTMVFAVETLSSKRRVVGDVSPGVRRILFQDSTSPRAGAYSLAQEDESKSSGENAFSITDDEHTIGVADGVGRWAEHGIDSGVYARQLMGNASKFVENHSSIDGGVNPMSAFENRRAAGASTACIIILKDNALQAVNVGNSSPPPVPMAVKRKMAVAPSRRILNFEDSSPVRRRLHFEDIRFTISKAAISRFTSGMAPKYFR